MNISGKICDPFPADDGYHYKSFIDIYGKPTAEGFLSSLKGKANRGHENPFNPTKQHSLNTNHVSVCGKRTKPIVSSITNSHFPKYRKKVCKNGENEFFGFMRKNEALKF